jgi:exodeoxyribonuclease-3
MKIATWNVNSLKVRLPQVLDWLAATQGRRSLPAGNQAGGQGLPLRMELEAAGYRAVHAARRPTTAWRSWRAPPRGRAPGHSRLCRRAETRHCRDGGWRAHRLRLHAQRPGGRLGQVRVQAALARGTDALAARGTARWPRLALLGDYNIAPDDRDVHDPRPGRTRSSAANRSAPPSAACSTSASSRCLPAVRAAGKTLLLVGLPA